MKHLNEFIKESIESEQNVPTLEEKFNEWCSEIIESEKIETQEALDDYLKENIDNFYEKYELSDEEKDNEKLFELAKYKI